MKIYCNGDIPDLDAYLRWTKPTFETPDGYTLFSDVETFDVRVNKIDQEVCVFIPLGKYKLNGTYHLVLDEVAGTEETLKPV